MTIPHSRNWHSDNLDTSHFTDAGSGPGHPHDPKCPCTWCRPQVPPDVYMRGMACAEPDDDGREQSGAWLGLVMLAAVFLAGLALCWLAAGIGR